ncbi:MAG: DUF2007 domain-containing protein [Deltaproteobacteria bacterium]|nr:DUF2007 domain-containing protein [Deltaproteobacteria bacterium]
MPPQPDSLVTVATYDDPLDANLARNVLLAGGVEAVLLDEHAVASRHVGGTFGGIRLQVLATDEAQAMELLAEGVEGRGEYVDGVPDELRDDDHDRFGDRPGRRPADRANGGAQRDAEADRAMTAAAWSILVPPLALLVAFRLWRVATLPGPLDPWRRRKATLAGMVAAGAAAVGTLVVFLFLGYL